LMAKYLSINLKKRTLYFII